jgi:metallo-beta-lactamase family protein
MSHGGRILHHERRYLSDVNSTILFVGYQAQGSLGRQIIDGAKSVKIFGEEIPVNCKVKAIGGYSAHADQAQLINWLKQMRETLKNTFVVQGEEEASIALAQKIRDELAVEAVVPDVDADYVV